MSLRDDLSTFAAKCRAASSANEPLPVWRGANLSAADLSDADLSDADLSGAKHCVSAGPVGAVRRLIYGVAHADGPRFQAGCFWGTADELRAAIAGQYADGSGVERFRASYLAAVDFICAALAAQEVPDAPTA